MPVTALSQIVDTDINKIAMATTFKTGVAMSRNAISVLDKESNSLEKNMAGIKINSVVPILSLEIRMINGFTSLFLP